MSELTIKHIDDMHSGEHAGPQKFLDLARGLGVSGMDMKLIKLPPNNPDFPAEAASDGEAVYVVLEGDAILHTSGRTTELNPGVFVRVGASVERTIVPGDVGATILAIGSTRH
jgi:uncharacterized cupin superfamily protein